MQLLHKMSAFGASIDEMKDIYIKFIRSILEFSCVVWGNSLTKENIDDLERIQKTAVKIILKERYKTYRCSLNLLNIQTLVERRKLLSLSFGKSCLKKEITKSMFARKHNSTKKKVQVC